MLVTETVRNLEYGLIDIGLDDGKVGDNMSTLKYIELQQHMLLWFGNHTLSLPHIVAVTPHFFPIYFRRRHHSSNAYARTGSLFLRQNINYQKRLTSDIWSDITKGNWMCLPYVCV